MSIRTVSVVGLGYIGLPTAAVIAARGVDVIGVDTSARVVETINRGEIHIVEPALASAVREAVITGALRATTEPQPADVFLVAVPTPITAEKCADLSCVMSAAAAIAPVLERGNLVILESTSPVGTTEALCQLLASARPDMRFPARGDSSEPDVYVAYCPERVLPGKIVQELVSNDRAIGGMTASCSAKAAELYRLFVQGELIETDARSAELCKLAENAYRDVNIAYANELANVCETLGMDVWEVIRLANRHPRVQILNPGPGVGGHCIAVDPWFIAEAAPKETPLIQAARHVNDERPERVAQCVIAAARSHASKFGAVPAVALLGLTFKPNIDDLRESPAIEVASILAKAGGMELLAVEPNVPALPAVLLDAGIKHSTLEAAIKSAEIIVLLVDHSAFLATADDLRGKTLIDTRGAWREMQRQSRVKRFDDVEDIIG
ncbi:MAG: UDP-N-acetyl-D-mannosamine dehydrogenase [Hyphomonadaceae bacterium]